MPAVVSSQLTFNTDRLTLLLLPKFGELAIPAARRWKHKGTLAGLGIEHLGEILHATLLRYGIIRVLQLLSLEGVLDALHHCLVTLPVVDDRVTLGSVYHALDMVLCFAGNADQRVNVGANC